MAQSLRELVWQRANAICEYCQMPRQYDDLPFQIDHIIAEKHDGATSPDNLALSCYYDNSYKGPNIAGIDPLTGALAALYHPRRDDWGIHFECSGAEIVGLTPVGRATIQVLCMNLEERVALRQALIDEGVFPPNSPRALKKSTPKA